MWFGCDRFLLLFLVSQPHPLLSSPSGRSPTGDGRSGRSGGEWNEERDRTVGEKEAGM